MRRLFNARLIDDAQRPADHDVRLAEASYAEVPTGPVAGDVGNGAPDHGTDTTHLGLEALLAAAAEFPVGEAADEESTPTSPSVEFDATLAVQAGTPGFTEPEAEQGPPVVAQAEAEPVFAMHTVAQPDFLVAEAEADGDLLSADAEPAEPAGLEPQPRAAVGTGADPRALVVAQTLVGIVAVLLLGSIVVTIEFLADNDIVPADGQLVAPVSSGLATHVVTAGNPTSGAVGNRPLPPNPLSTPASKAVPTATARTRDRVALRTDTLVARAWPDSAGTVRVHVIVSVTNDTMDYRSLMAAERTFKLISAAGRTVHTGRFPYAFPFVIPPGGTSHLITTAVLPVGVDGSDLRVESDIVGDFTTAVQPMLEVSDLRLVSSGGRPAVRGIVRNTGAEEVRFGVVAVIGRNASGRVIGGLYDNVNVASIAAGGEATFQTEYPGLPPAAAGRMADLSGVAFDVGTSLP